MTHTHTHTHKHTHLHTHTHSNCLMYTIFLPLQMALQVRGQNGKKAAGAERGWGKGVGGGGCAEAYLHIRDMAEEMRGLKNENTKLSAALQVSFYVYVFVCM
jgi:hypothetical protein